MEEGLGLGLRKLRSSQTLPSGLPDSGNGTPFTLLSRPKALDFSMCIFLYHLGLGFEQCGSITYSENQKLVFKNHEQGKTHVHACAQNLTVCRSPDSKHHLKRSD